MKKVLLLLAATAALVSLSACNTIHGAGQDIEKGGEKVQDAADKTKAKM